MANKKISQLPSASPLSGTEELELNQSLVSVKTTLTDLQTFVNSAIDLSGYVPYTGATTDLDLGSNDFTTEGTSFLSETRIAHGTIANQGIVFRSQVGTASNGAIYMSVVPSATNYSLVYDAINNQTRINGTGGVVLSHNNNSRMIVNSANMAFVLGGGAADLIAYNFTVPTAANSTSNESPGFRVVNSSGKNFPTGTMALQREVLFTSPTFTFTAASNLTVGASVGAEYPLGGTNANILSGVAFYVRTKAVTNTVTSYGLLIEASTGATNNYSARFTGGLGVLLSATNIVTDTTTGLKLGTATTQKLGFFNATPIVQVGATTDLGVALSNLGLRAAGTAYPITTSGALAFSGAATFSSATDTIHTNQNVQIATSGKGLIVKAGTNARIGQATLASGTVTVANTSVTANTKIFLQGQGATNAGFLYYTLSAGVSFTITSSNILDARLVDWFLVESN